MVARQVARSTGDAAQKIAEKGKKDLDLLEVTAERVAGSTSEAVHKLKSNPQEGAISVKERSLQNTTGLAAKSSPDSSGEQDLLSMARHTAERVAWSTSIAVGKLANAEGTHEYSLESGDPLELTRLTAEKVAKSTNEAVEKLKPNSPLPLDPNLKQVLDPNLEHVLDPDLELDPNLEHVPDPNLEQVLDPNLEQVLKQPGAGNEGQTLSIASDSSQLFSHSKSFQSAGQGVPPPTVTRTQNGTHNLLHSASPVAARNAARVLPLTPSTEHQLPLPAPIGNDDIKLGTARYPPQPHPTPPDTSRMLPQPPGCIGENALAFSTSRQLPMLPQSLPMSVGGSTRILPATPESPVGNSNKLPSKPTAAIFKPATLMNGYHHHSPVLVPGHGYMQHSGTTLYKTKSLDSDSEYSTTESVELTAQLLTPEYRSSKQPPPGGDTDLKTNPMKRMSHTAEMVAESTGKAVHRLTSTLA